MSTNAVVELGEGGHAQRRVVGGIDLEMVANAIAGIDAWIDGEGHLVPRVLDGDEACREGEALQENVVLEVEREVGAVQSDLIMAEGLVKRLAKIGADDVLVAELGTEGSTPGSPVEPAVEIDAEDIAAMVVEGHTVFRAANQFETVIRAIPIDGGAEV